MVFIQLISAASNRFSGVPSELVLSSTSQKDFISVIRSFLSSYSISNFELVLVQLAKCRNLLYILNLG
jgi:hypothetical protein